MDFAVGAAFVFLIFRSALEKLPAISRPPGYFLGNGFPGDG